MSTTDHIAACPKCGGTTGVMYTARYTATRVTGWDGEDEEVDIQKFTEPKTGRCQDCGARVPLPRPSV